MLAEFPHCSPTKVFYALQHRFPEDDLPCLRTVQRYVNHWQEQNKALIKSWNNPDAWKNESMVAFGKMTATRLYQIVEADSTPVDIVLTDGRYSIVGMIDTYSRQMRLLVSKTSKATAIAALLRRWVLDLGVPETLKTDNGKDYTSNHMTRVLADLGIEQVLCPPFQPWHKGHIERGLGTFLHDMLELMPGFTGHNVADRQEIRSRQAFGDRMFKKTKFVELSMTPVELQKFCDDWCKAYECKPHAGLDGKTPFEVVANWQQPIKRVQNERALDLLLAEAPGRDGVRSITKRGIMIDKIDYIAAELGGYVGHKVQIRLDPIDMGRIYVFTSKFEFICVAVNPELTGIDRREIAIAAKVEQNRVVKKFRRAMRGIKKAANVAMIGEAINIKRAKASGKLVQLRPTEVEEHITQQLLSLDDAAKAATETIEPIRERSAKEAAEHAAAVRQIESAEQAQEQVKSHELYERWRDKQIPKIAEVYYGRAEMHLAGEELAKVARYIMHGPGAVVLRVYLDDPDDLPAALRWVAAFLPVEDQAV